MWIIDSGAVNAIIDWLVHGFWQISWWQKVLFTLGLTHITIATVTIFLHRHQAHRSLDLNKWVAHFFRFWLWLTTGMVTKEWVAIHRKHHAKCETLDDPHSPQIFGIRKVFWEGAELYSAETHNKETMARFGHGTPNDWIERNVYSIYKWQGVGLMLIVDLALFGASGAVVWAVQMAWIPVTAAGVINGIGHYWGYRNFEVTDHSTNIFPWGILIGGEELHNNHHTYPTSAKLSVKPFEFDIGWVYISLFQALGLAKVKKTPPRLALGHIKAAADEHTLEALINHRFEIMAGYARGMQLALHSELQNLRAKSADLSFVKAADKWLHRDEDKVPDSVVSDLAKARAASPVLEKMVVMREELRQLWLNTNRSREQLLADLQAWCQRAEASGIAVLRDFSIMLRAVRA
jgi:stearoyl-CoA desaturase (delta-9 desaturase)